MCNVLIYDIPFGIRVFMHRDGVIREAKMLLPCGADQCPECYGYDTLVWVDEDRQEMNVEHLDCLVQIRKLELQDYLSPDVLEIENNEYYK